MDCDRQKVQSKEKNDRKVGKRRNVYSLQQVIMNCEF